MVRTWLLNSDTPSNEIGTQKYHQYTCLQKSIYTSHVCAGLETSSNKQKRNNLHMSSCFAFSSTPPTFCDICGEFSFLAYYVIVYVISLFYRLATVAKMMPYKKMGEDCLITKDPETPKGQTAIPPTVMVVPGSQTTNPVSDPSIMKRFPHHWPFAMGNHRWPVVPFTEG